MSIEENKKLVRLYFEIPVTGRLELYDQIMGPDFYVRHLRDKGQQAPQEERGSAAFKQFASGLKSTYPDGMVTIDEMTAEGDRVIVAWTFQGTQQGEFLGLAPTNKKITYVGVNGFRIGEGKLVEGWDLQDSLNLFQQLGLLPDTGTILTQASDKKD